MPTILDTRTAPQTERDRKQVWVGPYGDRTAVFFHPTDNGTFFLLPKGQVQERLFDLEYNKKFQINKR